MIKHIRQQIIKTQTGFTLIELLISLAITGLIVAGAAMATNQVLAQSDRNGEYTTASQHAMNALYWVSRDAQMSQSIQCGENSGFPLTLYWTQWDNSEHQVIYSIQDGVLRRNYSIDGGAAIETIVAQYINSTDENTLCEFSSLVFTVKVTATLGEGTRTVSVTKIREITPRPGL